MFDCLTIGLAEFVFDRHKGLQKKMQPNWKKGNGSVLYFMYMYKYVTTKEY